MATVYITGRLLDDVRNRIDAMCRAEIKSDYPSYGAIIRADASELFNIAQWGSHRLALLEQLPKEWLLSPQEENITFLDQHDEQGNKLEKAKERYQLRFGPLATAYYRPTPNSWNRVHSTMSLKTLNKFKDKPGAAEALAAIEDAKGAKALEAKWNKVANDVVKFLSSCKSLNEAIKLLPSIKLYIPKEDIARVEHKVERSKERRERIVATVDPGELTAAAMAAQLSGALTL